MKKIPTLFQRDGEFFVTPEVTPGCEWVLAGEGKATYKWDGTCCLIKDGKLFKRYDSHGKEPPPNFIPAMELDEATGHLTGWLPVGDGPEDKYFREAWAFHLEHRGDLPVTPGTYEMIGPKVGGNPHKTDGHVLVIHGNIILPNVPRDYIGLQNYLSILHGEGIVWHHPDGRMCKIKRADFGYAWGNKKARRSGNPPDHTDK